jgi:hypothetical protein
MEISDVESNILKKELKKVAQINELILETKDLMKPYQERLKQLKFEKKELEKEICPNMEKYNCKVAEIENANGKVEYKVKYEVKQSMVPVTQKSLKEKMASFFKDGPGSYISFNSKRPEDKGQELFDYIYAKENRKFVKKEELVVKS